MMGRWGLEGMGSFEQVGVARKERRGLEGNVTGIRLPLEEEKVADRLPIN